MSNYRLHHAFFFTGVGFFALSAQEVAINWDVEIPGPITDGTPSEPAPMPEPMDFKVLGSRTGNPMERLSETIDFLAESKALAPMSATCGLSKMLNTASVTDRAHILGKITTGKPTQDSWSLRRISSN